MFVNCVAQIFYTLSDFLLIILHITEMCVEIAHEMVILPNFQCNFVISAHFSSYRISFIEA